MLIHAPCGMNDLTESWCVLFFFFSSRRRHTRYWRDWSSDVCSSDLIRRHLPARQVDRRHAGLHLLHRLVAGEGAERIDEGLLAAQLPELFRAKLRERVLDPHAAAQPHHVFGAVAALHALPTRVLLPVLFELRGLLLLTAHHRSCEKKGWIIGTVPAIMTRSNI